MISPERWKLVQPILDGAFDLGEGELSRYLDEACREDPALRSEVERLLTLARGSGDRVRLLDVPIDRAAAVILSGESETVTSDALAPEQMVGPYRVARRIGAGGMGVVYLAHDERLDRLVALKLLPPWLAADEDAIRRFTDEARAASALDHPNIATIYDIGRTGEAGLYIAMAYYEGETLRERLRSGPLAAVEARAIAIQLAEGLRAAHAKGIVHRDIKPANIVLTRDGVAKIVDFGVAKVADRTAAAPGATPGTVAYMSPEQTTGEEVDARSDIWSLGVVLYEMLTGARPFPGDGPAEIIVAIRHRAPEPITQKGAGTPAALDRAVARCLEKDPDKRFADVAALLAALRAGEMDDGDAALARAPRIAWVAAAVILISIGSAAYWMTTSYRSNPERSGPAHRIAVLPMRNAGGDPTNAYFAAGLTEELIARLSKVRGLNVIAHRSVVPYEGREPNPAEVVSALEVRSILDGSVTSSGDRVGVALKLIEGTTQELLWEKQYEAALVELPVVQREIAEQVATALQIGVGSDERTLLSQSGSGGAEAYRSYLRGRYWLAKSDPPSYVKARAEFERALDLEPAYALAWVGLSDAFDHLAGNGLMPSVEAIPRARKAAERALELEPDLAEAHAALAMTLTSHNWENERAERHFRRAIDLSPSYARAHRTYASHLRNLCRLDEARAEANRAAALDPLDFFSHFERWAVLYFGRRFDDAVTEAERLVELNAIGANLLIALSHTQRREYELALTALDRVPGHPHARAVRGHVYGAMGRREEARTLLREYDARSADAGVHRAAIHVGLGEPDAALAALERAYEVRHVMLRLLKGEPMFDPLRSDPRFADLLKRIGLTDASPCRALEK